MNTVLVRVNAGPETGMGHLQRCLSLAVALQREGASVRLLMNRNPATPAYLERFGLTAETVNAPSWSREDLAATLEAATRHAVQAVLVDARDVAAEYLDGLRAAGCFVIVRDDTARFPFSCQVVLNGNADARRLRYASSSGDTRFLLGPEYAVLREEFWSVAPRTIRPTVGQILVILGGADPQRLMPGLLRLLDGMPGAFAVTAIIGPYFDNIAEIRQAASTLRRPVRLLENQTLLRELMVEADLAISGGGQTLYELARTGCPTVAIQVGADQAGQLQALADAGCVRSVGNVAEGDVLSRVRGAVAMLMDDASARAAMAQAGQRVVDGQGAPRVVTELLGISQLQGVHH